MKIKTKFLFLLSFLTSVFLTSDNLLFAQLSRGKPPSRSIQKLQYAIDKILNDSALTPCIIGVKIVSLENGRVLYSRNNNLLYHPASNTKLLTTATALALLDSQFTFKTIAFAEQTPADNELGGNLYVKGYGDPLFTTPALDSLVKLIRQAGINKITGNIIGDVTYFDDLYWGAGWMWDDEPEYYEAFISPLTINGNCVDIKVMPGLKPGDSLRYSLEPPLPYFVIKNQGITTNDTLVPPLNVTRLKHENTITISGRISPTDTGETFTLSIWKPEWYFLELLKSKLIEHGIEFKGKVLLDTLRPSVKIAEIAHPLDSVLHQINKPSDNLAAENLLKTMAAEKFGPPGNANNGLTLVKAYLASIGIDTTAIVLGDGSGLSPYNLVSPDAIVTLLQKQYENKTTFQRFYESLPLAGVEGTLKNRMQNTRAFKNVKAKTGTLLGVSTLSGYVTTADSTMLAFSIMANHYPKELRTLRIAQDKIMDLLANFRFKK
jgi:D-alanyl-D-alanine carboxypeptidase/D-alanyl-D-alanine-endopeptidase (penicillin-binding protein 4)